MQIRFCITTNDDSIRTKELENSERRAHAARTAHLRRFSKVRTVQSSSTTVEGTKSYVELAVVASTSIHGSSDPFSCFEVKITPRINYILTFMRDVMYPAIYHTAWTKSCSTTPGRNFEIAKPSGIVSAGSAYRDWSRMLWTLQDEGLGLACLSACASMVPQFQKTMNIDVLKMRARSTSLLREKLEVQSSSYVSSGRALLHMFWLFEAEALNGNVEAAILHGGAFRVAVEACQEEAPIDIANIVMFLWADTNFAARTMRRTMLGMNWCAARFQGMWDRLEALFPLSASPEAQNLNPAIEATTLVSTCPTPDVYMIKVLLLNDTTNIF